MKYGKAMQEMLAALAKEAVQNEHDLVIDGYRLDWRILRDEALVNAMRFATDADPGEDPRLTDEDWAHGAVRAWQLVKGEACQSTMP